MYVHCIIYCVSTLSIAVTILNITILYYIYTFFNIYFYIFFIYFNNSYIMIIYYIYFTYYISYKKYKDGLNCKIKIRRLLAEQDMFIYKDNKRHLSQDENKK